RRPRVDDIGLETVGVAANAHGVPVDTHMRVRDRLWAVGDVTGIWQLTHVGKYQAEVAASNILGEPREANYDAVPRVVFTDPQAAAVGATDARYDRTERCRQDSHLHAFLCRIERIPYAFERRRAIDGSVRPRPRGGRVASAGHVSDPGPRAACDVSRHDPAVPHFFRDFRPCASRLAGCKPQARSCGTWRGDSSGLGG